jgi:hypothetical protein
MSQLGGKRAYADRLGNNRSPHQSRGSTSTAQIASSRPFESNPGETMTATSTRAEDAIIPPHLEVILIRERSSENMNIEL